MSGEKQVRHYMNEETGMMEEVEILETRLSGLGKPARRSSDVQSSNGHYIYEDIRREIMFCGEPDCDNHILIIPEKRRQELYKASRAICPNSRVWESPTRIYKYQIHFDDCNEIKLETI